MPREARQPGNADQTHHDVTPHTSQNAESSHSGDDRGWRGRGEGGSLLRCGGNGLVQPLWETMWRVLKTARRELPSHPAVALLGVCPKDTD